MNNQQFTLAQQQHRRADNCTGFHEFILDYSDGNYYCKKCGCRTTGGEVEWYRRGILAGVDHALEILSRG